jgi:hypothetical protein
VTHIDGFVPYPRVGFTGTRGSITGMQASMAVRYLQVWRDRHGACEFHHGDCVGADAYVAESARRLGYRIVSHPPLNTRHRAYVPADVELPPLTYIMRNHDIVDTASVMLALPRTEDEELRSGTWATIRYARTMNCPLVVIGPSGAFTVTGDFE